MGYAILRDIILDEELEENLFSYQVVMGKGYKLQGEEKDVWLVDKKEKEVLWAKLEGKEIVIQIEEATRFTSYQECHNALGHPSVQVLNQAMNDSLYLDTHLIPKPPKNFHCSACSLSKSTHQVPGASYKRAANPFELIHTDLSGKFSVPSIVKRLYYITFIDDRTRYTWIAFLSKKSDTTRVIKDFVIRIDRQYSNKILRFRSDNGGEYIDYFTGRNNV